MSPTSEVVLINPFVVGREQRDEYLAKYHVVMERLSRQPGFLGGSLHQAIDADRARFQFVKVNRWSSADAFRAGISAANPSEVFGDLVHHIEASPALFTVETTYATSGG